MKKYKNKILLKDYNDESVDAIIFTNENTETIQQAIYKAKNEYIKLEETNNVPMGINCEFEYVYCYLLDNFKCLWIYTWNEQEVYY